MTPASIDRHPHGEAAAVRGNFRGVLARRAQRGIAERSEADVLDGLRQADFVDDGTGEGRAGYLQLYDDFYPGVARKHIAEQRHVEPAELGRRSFVQRTLRGRRAI